MNLNSLQVSPSPVANSQLDDVELLRRSRRLGFMTLAARRRFLATLPEIEQRKLVPREYASIFEYAARTGGASRRQVQEILAAHRRLRTLPQIWMLLEDGVIGLSKLHRVPRALLHENPARWAEALESCSREALVRLVREAQGHPSGEGPTISVADRSGKPEGALEVLDLFSTSTSEDWGGANEPPSYPARDVQGLLRLLGRRGR